MAIGFIVSNKRIAGVFAVPIMFVFTALGIALLLILVVDVLVMM